MPQQKRGAPTKIWQSVHWLTDRQVEWSRMYTLHSVRLRSVTEPLQHDMCVCMRRHKMLEQRATPSMVLVM